jgi:cell division protein FtsQ
MLNATAGIKRRAARRSRPAGGTGRAARAQYVLGVLLRSGRLPAFLVMLGALVLLYGFMFSRDFLIASVVVRGTELGNPAEVVVVADAVGESIFRIDAGHAAGRVAALPYVERVTVATRFPDEVVISVVERKPAVLWQSGSSTFLVDVRGNVIANGTLDGLPSVVVDGAPPEIGSQVDAATVAAVMALRAELGAQIAELRITTTDGIVLRLNDKRSIIIGEPSSVPVKLAVLAEVERRGEPWALLDLREPARPYYK